MMKNIILTGVVLFGAVAGEAMAACTDGTQVTNAALTNLLTDRQVCAQLGSDKWQEEHRSGGSLWDYKLGPVAPGNIDPTKQVGTWNISGTDENTVVTYNYGPGAVYSYKVYNQGASYSFCGTNVTTEITGAHFQAAGACP